MVVLVQLNDEKPRLIFVADKREHLKGLFPSLAMASGALSWARRAGLAATSIFDVMPLRSRQQEGLNVVVC